MINVKPGDIFFVMHHDNWISKAIAWFMKSQWSHSGMVIDTTSTLNTYLCETSDYEVTIGRLERYIDDPNVTMEVWSPTAMTDDDRRVVVERCKLNIETLYGYLQLFSFAVRALLSRIKIRIPNFIRQGYVCDENWLSGYALSKATNFYGIDPKSIQTEESYEQLVAGGCFTKVFSK